MLFTIPRRTFVLYQSGQTRAISPKNIKDMITTNITNIAKEEITRIIREASYAWSEGDIDTQNIQVWKDHKGIIRLSGDIVQWTLGAKKWIRREIEAADSLNNSGKSDDKTAPEYSRGPVVNQAALRRAARDICRKYKEGNFGQQNFDVYRGKYNCIAVNGDAASWSEEARADLLEAFEAAETIQPILLEAKDFSPALGRSWAYWTAKQIKAAHSGPEARRAAKRLAQIGARTISLGWHSEELKSKINAAIKAALSETETTV